MKLLQLCAICTLTVIFCGCVSGTVMPYQTADHPIELVGHAVKPLSDEVATLKGQIPQPQGDPDLQLELRVMWAGMPRGKELPQANVAETTDKAGVNKLFEQARMERGRMTLSVTALPAHAGKHELFDMTADRAYAQDYAVQDGAWTPVAMRISEGGYVVLHAQRDGEDVVIEELAYKRARLAMIRCTARLRSGVTSQRVLWIEPLVATEISEGTSDIRLKPGEYRALPVRRTLERGSSNLRSVLESDEVEDATDAYSDELGLENSSVIVFIGYPEQKPK